MRKFEHKRIYLPNYNVFDNLDIQEKILNQEGKLGWELATILLENGIRFAWLKKEIIYASETTV